MQWPFRKTSYREHYSQPTNDERASYNTVSFKKEKLSRCTCGTHFLYISLTYYIWKTTSDKLRVRVPRVIRYNAKWRSSPRLRHLSLGREGVGSYLFSFFSHLLVSAGNVQQRFHLEIEKSRTWCRKSAFFQNSASKLAQNLKQGICWRHQCAA